MNIILGAGVSGLSCAYHLKKFNLPCQLLEKAEQAGGLCRSYQREGFTFDITGHWLHLKNPYTQKLLEQLLPGLAVIRRRAMVRTQGIYTDYPYQINTHGLPPATIVECLEGFIKAEFDRSIKPDKKAANFAHWINIHLGEGFAKNFMLPYNRKLWTRDPEQLDPSWCRKYVPIPTIRQVLAGAFGIQEDKIGYNATFRYPVKGGCGTLVESLQTQLDPGQVKCGVEIKHIDPAAKQVYTSKGNYKYQKLISTLPLPVLAHLLPWPKNLIKYFKRLQWSKVFYINLGVREGKLSSPGPGNFHWIYFPEPQYSFYRVGSYSNVMPSMAPAGCSSYYLEFSLPRDKNITVKRNDILKQLTKLNILGPEDQVQVWDEGIIDYAYVIPDMEYKQIREEILSYLRGFNIIPLGRYGAWCYSSIEDSLLEGREVAESCR